jgi:hypothetical protein
MSIEHSPLRDRERPLSSDVADALQQLIWQTDDRLREPLPRAFGIADIVSTLVEIAHAEDDGTIGYIAPIVRRSLTDMFTNRLINSSVFQAGYKQFEKRTGLPIVPITDFFFKNEMGAKSVADMLETLSEYEIKQSLPKRPHAMRDRDSREIMRDDDGDTIDSGSIAGIVVFPQNAHHNLLRSWLMRRANAANGQLRSAVSALEHARPDTQSVAALKDAADSIKPALSRALPRPKT